MDFSNHASLIESKSGQREQLNRLMSKFKGVVQILPSPGEYTNLPEIKKTFYNGVEAGKLATKTPFRLTADQKLSIRKVYRAFDGPPDVIYAELAKVYKVSKHTIKTVAHGRLD